MFIASEGEKEAEKGLSSFFS